MKTKLLLLATVLLGFMSQAQVVHLTGNAVGGWNNPPLAQNLMSTTDNVNYTLANVQMTASGFKFMRDSNWSTTRGYYMNSTQWPSGSTSPLNCADSGNGCDGNDITAVAGFWNVAYNLVTGAYSFTTGVSVYPTLNITNSVTPIAMSTSNGVNFTALSTTLAAGTFLFAEPSSSSQWGNAAFPSGTATIGGAGVNVTAGTYDIVFDKSTGGYSFTRVSVGMIGVGSPSGSWGADAVMAVQPDGVTYKITNATIVGGIMLFRDNAQWSFKYGWSTVQSQQTFPSGIAVLGGGDITTTSGTYDITFNRSTGAYNFGPPLSSYTFEKSSFVVSPNPSNNSWKIASASVEISSVQIIDVLGKVVYSNNKTSNEVNVDASTFTNGIYFAKIASANGSETIKLVKN